MFDVFVLLIRSEGLQASSFCVEKSLHCFPYPALDCSFQCHLFENNYCAVPVPELVTTAVWFLLWTKVVAETRNPVYDCDLSSVV